MGKGASGGTRGIGPPSFLFPGGRAARHTQVRPALDVFPAEEASREVFPRSLWVLLVNNSDLGGHVKARHVPRVRGGFTPRPGGLRSWQSVSARCSPCTWAHGASWSCTATRP